MMPRAALLVTLLAVEAQAARPQDLERQVPAKQPTPLKEVSVLQANSSDEHAQRTGMMQEKLQKIRESVVQLQKFRNLEEDALEHFVEQVGSSARDASLPSPSGPVSAPDAIEKEKSEKEKEAALKDVKTWCLKLDSGERLPCCQAECTNFGTRFAVTEQVRVTCMTPCMNAVEEVKSEKETALEEVKSECLKIDLDERLPCCQAECKKFVARFDVTQQVQVTCMKPCMNAQDSMLEKDTKKDAEGEGEGDGSDGSDSSDGRHIGQPDTLASGAVQERAAPNSSSSSSSSLLETKQEDEVASSSFHGKGAPRQEGPNYNDLPDASDLEKAIAGVERPLAEATKQASTSLDSAVTWSQVPPLMERHVKDMAVAVQEAKGYLVEEQERVRGDVQKTPEDVLTHENYMKDQSGDAGRKAATHLGDSA